MSLIQLLKAIEKHFTIDEIHTLCFEIGIQFENLDAKTLTGISRSLVEQCQREGSINELLEACRNARPHVSWESMENENDKNGLMTGLELYGVFGVPSYKEKYRTGWDIIINERQAITEFLCEYYSRNIRAVDQVFAVRYTGNDEYTNRTLPLVTHPDLVHRFNPGFKIKCIFDEKDLGSLPISEHDFEQQQALWDAAGLSIWENPTYSINNILHSGEFFFVRSTFKNYRATFGSVLDELALALGSFGLEYIREDPDKYLPRRKRLLGSIDILLDISNRICIGGPDVLLAIRTESDDLALIIQRRSPLVSDEPGSLSVIPKATHEPNVDIREEVEVESTIYREVYEELFGGEDSSERHLSSRYYIPLCPPVAELINNGSNNHEIQPVGFSWDLLRGNYHPVYCLYIHDPGWWEKYKDSVILNWESHKSEGKGLIPILFASQQQRLQRFIAQTDWVPESYFAFIEGLRWLGKRDALIEHVLPLLPRLEMSDLRIPLH